MIEIDGSAGEGGGQILRTALALSLVTATPFRIKRIRAGRPKPGLLLQHLTAVGAAAHVGGAEIEGAALGSTRLEFRPTRIVAGDAQFAVGTAGSATLVLQTVLPALLTARGPSKLVLEGGTHNPFAPPFDFVERAFLPIVRRMGARIDVRLERHGFYPAGGGRFRVSVDPVARLERLDLLERGGLERTSARALVAGLPRGIGDRELEVVREALSLDPETLRVEEIAGAGRGNVVLIMLECEHVTEVVTGFGERRVPAEDVARKALDEARSYLESDAPVGVHLADQLLLPMALAGGGSFCTVAPSRHTTTNMDVLRRFLPIEVRIDEESRDRFRIDIVSR